MIVYKITNTANGKLYVGQTTRSLRLRWNEHCRSNGCGIKLKQAIKKYGKESFKIETIQICTSVEDLNNAEEYWIGKLRTVELGYNLESGGKNKIPSEETRIKMSETQTVIQNKPDVLIATSKRMTALWKNPSYIKKMSSVRRGVPKSDTWKKNAKTRAADKKIPITQYDTKGNIVAVFASSTDAALALGISRANIVSNCKGRSKTAYGYIWKHNEVNCG